MIEIFETWFENRAKIIVLAFVNTSITAANEALARIFNAHLFAISQYNSFLVFEGGSYFINRQSLVNIWSTLITSLLGGVVFFMEHKTKRFLFFTLFGICVAVLSQVFSNLIRDQTVYIDRFRLFFDLTYLLSIKYLVFELGRKTIVSSFKTVSRIGGIRLIQDFITTFLRVTALNFFGFKG